MGQIRQYDNAREGLDIPSRVSIEPSDAEFALIEETYLGNSRYYAVFRVTGDQNYDRFTVIVEEDFDDIMLLSGSISKNGNVLVDLNGFYTSLSDLAVFGFPSMLDGSDTVIGNNYNDTLRGFENNDKLDGNGGNDRLFGMTGDDTLFGDSGHDLLDGGTGNDWHAGGGGRDTLIGGRGNDTLTGGEGTDRLNGGYGRDVFIFKKVSEIGRGLDADIIVNFQSGTDKINLRQIDANNAVRGDQAFQFIDDDGFSGRRGQLRYDNGRLQGDVNGDRIADFGLVLEDAPFLRASDIIH